MKSETHLSAEMQVNICSAYPRGVSEMIDPYTLYKRSIEARIAEIERGITYNQMAIDKYKELFKDENP